MKKLNVLLAFAFFALLSTSALAQDEITDEDLRRYALLDEVVDAMKSEISDLTKEIVAKQEGIDGKRFNELNKGQGEPASEFEQKFMDLVNKKKDERIADIKTVNSILATKMISGGAKKYKAVKAALKLDEAVKESYAKIQAVMAASEDGA